MQFMMGTYCEEASSVTLMMAMRGLGLLRFGTRELDELSRLMSAERRRDRELRSLAFGAS